MLLSESMRTIPLTKGQIAIVDDDDFDRLSLFKWQCNGLGYAIRRCKSTNKQRYMHHDILPPPEGYCVDHKDRNKLDNRKSNLRLATRSQNAQNRNTMRGKSKSTYKGVVWRKHRLKWEAWITLNGVRMYLGIFPNEEDAAIAYNVAAQLFFGQYAALNDV